MKSRKATKAEQDWLNSIAELGCIVCRQEGYGYVPNEIHHIDGKTKPDAHLKTIPLCYLHHRAGRDCDHYTSRHPFKARWEARYGRELDLLGVTQGLIESPPETAIEGF